MKRSRKEIIQDLKAMLKKIEILCLSRKLEINFEKNIDKNKFTALLNEIRDLTL